MVIRTNDVISRIRSPCKYLGISLCFMVCDRVGEWCRYSSNASAVETKIKKDPNRREYRVTHVEITFYSTCRSNSNDISTKERPQHDIKFNNFSLDIQLQLPRLSSLTWWHHMQALHSHKRHVKYWLHSADIACNVHISTRMLRSSIFTLVYVHALRTYLLYLRASHGHNREYRAVNFISRTSCVYLSVLIKHFHNILLLYSENE